MTNTDGNVTSFDTKVAALGSTEYAELPAGNWTGVVTLQTADGANLEGQITANVLPGLAYTAVVHVAPGDGALPEMLVSEDAFKTDKETPALKSWVKVVHASSTAGAVVISSDTDDDFETIVNYGDVDAPFLPIIASKQRLLIRAAGRNPS